ncbi:hypothetical protein CBL_00291 [Carabus blaptoides fortunei]
MGPLVPPWRCQRSYDMRDKTVTGRYISCTYPVEPTCYMCVSMKLVFIDPETGRLTNAVPAHQPKRLIVIGSANNDFCSGKQKVQKENKASSFSLGECIIPTNNYHNATQRLSSLSKFLPASEAGKQKPVALTAAVDGRMQRQRVSRPTGLPPPPLAGPTPGVPAPAHGAIGVLGAAYLERR